MFRLTILLITGIILYFGDAVKISFPKDQSLSPLPKIRSDPAKYRLPGETIPSSYVLVLKIDPNQQESFWGLVNIDVTAEKPENQIVLHSNLKNITNISVEKSNGSNIYASHSLSNDDTHFLTIKLEELLEVNQKYKIAIEYYGNYGKNLRGLYLSSYLDDEGNRIYLTSTQFEAANARDAFPCYDEPGLKAIFQVNIYVPDGYHALSNADRTNETTLPPEDNGMTLYAFDPSPKMSSYLNAFVVSDFKFLSNLDEGQEQLYRKMFRIIARPNGIQHGNFSLIYGQKNIAVIEEYLDVEYPLSKLDNIAIPDFFAGAMENWGLAIYKESNLLYIPGVTTTRNLRSIVGDISHENGHFWFGNEVTPAWWDYLWLSEGYASYFEYYATDKVAPEWRMMEQFFSVCVHTAMEFDSLPITNPMTSSVASPSEIDSNFNLIAYQKSGSVARMMQHVLGQSNFQQGLRNYLKSIPKGVTRPEILFEGLQEAIKNTDILPEGVTISDIYGLWSTTPGFPIVYAKKSVGDRSITLKQERYYQNKSISNNGEKWWIPITWSNSYDHDFENTSVQEWFHPETTEHVINMNLRDNAWYILNKQAIGFYRIMYDEHNWKLLIEVLRSEKFNDIHILNRVQLIDDSLELARTLRLVNLPIHFKSYNVTLDILHYLQEEVDYIPWLSAYPGIFFLNTMMPATDNYFLYNEYIRRIVKKAYENVGFETNQDETPDVKMNRNILLDIACTAGINDCREKSRDLLEKWIENNTIQIDPDIKSVIYCAGIRNASYDLWNSYFKTYENLTSDSEKLNVLKNSACSENDEILKSYLLMAMSVEFQIPESHRMTIVESTIISGPKGVDTVMSLVTQNFTTIKEIMPLYTVKIIDTLSARVITETHARQFEEFATSYENFTIAEKNSADAAILVIKQNREWLEDVLYDIDPWLIENVKFTGNRL